MIANLAGIFGGNSKTISLVRILPFPLKVSEKFVRSFKKEEFYLITS